MVKKFFIGLFALILVLVLAYLLGPKPNPLYLNGELPEVTSDLPALESKINRDEAGVEGIKANNQARIVWYDSTQKEKTPYSIVYLHGFGASQAEGDPIHLTLARKYGCNLYLSRLKDQGIDTEDAFKEITAENYLASAKKAVAIGKALGDTVIIMATSTGGALGLYIASENPEIKAVIAYSPIVDTYEGTLFLARGPWGMQLTRMVQGDPVIEEREGLEKQYWSRTYHVEAYVALSVLVGNLMTPETFQNITYPVFIGYYYKNEEEQDKVVSVPKMLEMYDQLRTPDHLKRKVAFPHAGDHVIGSYIRSDDWQNVMDATDQFMQEVLHMEPAAVPAVMEPEVAEVE
jgi:pimeloyl-ACP methyl ester carboxylesterase